ncbi:MAG TPA: LysM peptidoglycan-binding domain-containing protein [Thermoanaerobaculia bacterium]|nr:LysM peptidoglycan-binding domain-containing protein [Thermoanaerobaculia bacterium]HUM29076.1 LysM peptidoglycan-binding domain-containing protein [Thermoanaerobaculia bacterium]HXK67368.1 LysM peptidoglycan-binding domain-containing protein [Thermoanaerobaculia bacterium]
MRGIIPLIFLILLCGLACQTTTPAPVETSPEIEPLSEPFFSEAEMEELDVEPEVDPLPIPPPPDVELDDTDIELFIPEDVSMLPPSPAVQRLIDYFTGEGREKFQEGLDRLAPVFARVSQIFREGDLPEHYLFLGMVESTFKVHARSRVGAFGPWQFMTGTARLYGLTVTPYVDERASWDRGTKTAVRYLNDLIDEMGGLELALASYNAGKGRVQSAIRRCRKKDFWAIRRCLPRETRNFVPSVLAAMKIGQNPSAYGFSFEPEQPVMITSTKVPIAADLKKMAERLGLEESTLLNLNPHLVSGFTPPSGASITVPAEVVDRMNESLLTHHVTSGETWSSIAARYEIQSKTLLAANPAFSSSGIQEGQVLYIPEFPEQVTYRVQRGDTPWSISRKFGVSLNALLSYNGLTKRSRIFPGQTLIIPGRKGIGASSPSSYRVRSGDTLFSIAQRFHTTVDRLIRANGLTSSIIRPGELLRID